MPSIKRLYSTIMHVEFSVLLSVYFKENPLWLSKALDSVLKQTVLPKEIVLVEDGPLTEELYKVINDYLQICEIIKLVKLKRNMGLGIALNEGLDHCSCQLIARMDTDDIAKPDRFEKQLRVFKNNLEIDVVGTWVDEFIDNINSVQSIRKLPENHDDIYRFSKRRNPINHPTVMFKKDAVLSVGGYKHFLLFEDYYLWARMLVEGYKFYNIQESLLYFRLSSDVYKRRGGYKYACTEIKFYNELKRIGLVKDFPSDFIKYLKFIIRILPNRLRAFIYKKIIR